MRATSHHVSTESYPMQPYHTRVMAVRRTYICRDMRCAHLKCLECSTHPPHKFLKYMFRCCMTSAVPARVGGCFAALSTELRDVTRAHRHRVVRLQPGRCRAVWRNVLLVQVRINVSIAFALFAYFAILRFPVGLVARLMVGTCCSRCLCCEATTVG